MVKEHIDTTEGSVSIDGTVINGISPDSIPFPKPSRGTKDVTTLKDTWQKKGVKLPDPGKASFTGMRIPGDAGQIALLAASKDGKEHVIQINIPEAGEVFTYNAFVSTDAPESKDETYQFSCDLEATGEPTIATTYASITSIEGAAVGITYSPASANTAFPAAPSTAYAVTSVANYVIFKETADITTDTVEVTAASASYIGLSVDGGKNWTELTSGTAATIPASIWPATGTISKALIMVTETGKATRFVDLFIARA
jgi:hypothetical protein